MTGQPTTTTSGVPPDRPQADEATTSTNAAELVLEDRFSMVPEWVLDADIGDCALRLYAVLLRYGNSTGARMPSRATLAARLHKRSVDTVDRALAELIRLGALRVEHRWACQQRLTNRYRIRTSRPARHEPASTTASGPGPGGGRTDAATRTKSAGGGRTDRGRVAARIGHDREPSTETPPPPPPPPPAGPLRSSAGPAGRPSPADMGRSNGTDPDIGSVEHWHRRHQDLLTGCGIISWQAWDDHVAQVRAARSAAGQPLSRWSPAHLLAALDLAVRGRGWPAGDAASALLHVAADPATRSPARLAEAGPWWDHATAAAPNTAADLVALEAELDTADGRRVQLQRTAREQLTAERRPLTRATVISRAVDLLRTHDDS